MKPNVPKYLICHHTGGDFDTSNQSFDDINKFHKNSPNVNPGYPSTLGYYIGYHYFIDKKGIVTQGRLDSDEGEHTIGMNTQSIGICLAGNFDITIPTPEQITALRGLLVQKMAQYSIPASNVLPHRHFASYKSCYGSKLSEDWAQRLVLPQTDAVSPVVLEEPTFELNLIWSVFQRIIQFLKRTK